MIETIETFLSKTNVNQAFVDISDMNMLDALRTSVLCSTKFFAKYPDKKICWSVKDEETKKAISYFMLNNMELHTKLNTTDSKVYALK